MWTTCCLVGGERANVRMEAGVKVKIKKGGGINVSLTASSSSTCLLSRTFGVILKAEGCIEVLVNVLYH